MIVTELEAKYNLTCHVNCPFFPTINEEVDWEYDENKVKRRVKSIKMVCGYDGHVINNWSGNCPYNKKLEKKVEEI